MKLLLLCLLGFALSAYASLIEKRAILNIKRTAGNCEKKLIGQQMHCIAMQGSERKNPYCYMFEEAPGGKYCMEVVLNPTTGAVDLINGPYRMVSVS